MTTACERPAHAGLRLPQIGKPNCPCSAAQTRKGELDMLHYAVVFLIIALIAALFGFTGIAAGATEIAKILFVVFLIFAAISFVVGLMRRG
jgi:uncharacterized membrane protein YtjA (UPF0391 family)